MKTLFCFDSFGEEDIFFFEKEGDYTHLDKVFINSTKDVDKQDELNDLTYDKDGKIIIEKLSEPTKDWDYFVIVGFLP